MSARCPPFLLVSDEEAQGYVEQPCASVSFSSHHILGKQVGQIEYHSDIEHIDHRRTFAPFATLFQALYLAGLFFNFPAALIGFGESFQICLAL